MNFLSNLLGGKPGAGTRYANYPAGIRYLLLLHVKSNDPQWRQCYDESRRIEAVIVGRNGQGQEREKQGNLDDAIRFYEQNVTDKADTPFPYDRLRIIYAKQKRFEEALRVCRAYVEMSREAGQAVLNEIGDKTLAKRLSDAGKFPNHIDKILAQQKKAQRN